jgi:deoxycytidylate deaminase
MIINSGVQEVVFENEYEFNEQTRALLHEAGVRYRRLVR